LASGRGWQGAAPPVSHHEGAWGIAREEGERQEELKKKKQKLYLPLLHIQGKKEEQCRSKRHCFVLFFFFT